MGLLDTVAGMLTGGGSSGQSGGQAALLQALLGMLAGSGQGGDPGGGLAGLVTKFQQGGLGDVVGSWVGTGQNLPISPEQLQQVLGPELAGLAEKFGFSPGDAGGQLSQLLPQVVDGLTPNGRLPDAAEGGLGDLGALLGSLKPR